jgi:hypothetical protein
MITQVSEDSVIGGRTVPKGYCNATLMCKANGKKLNDYLRLKRSKSYLEALSLDTGIPVTNLYIIIQGLGSGDEAGLQGTWVHPDVAISIAAWISPKFEVWANKTLRAVLNNQFEALDPEAQEIKKQLEQSWDEIRNQGKLTRRNFTDAIKGYLDTHEVSEGYRKWIYANCSDKLNKSVFGKRAKEIRIERCQYTGLIRDTHKNPDLRLLDRMEDYAARLIGQEDVEPMDAVNSAIAFYRPKYANQLG